MDALRLILLLIGLAVVVVIYWRSQRGRGDHSHIMRHFDSTFLTSFKSRLGQSQSAPLHPRRDAPLSEEELENAGDMVVEQSIDAADESEDVQLNIDDADIPGGEPLLITMTIMARGERIAGPQLAAALAAQGFHFGDMMAFHLYARAEQPKGMSVCTVLNVLEPGSFPDAGLEGIEVPGVVLLMRLPGPMEAREAFERTLLAGKQLASQLNADLCDETRSVMTQQTIAHLKEQVEAYRFKQKLAQLKRRPQ